MARKQGTCRLCGSDELLCHSHIIPEFFYKHMYKAEDKNRFYAFRLRNKKPATHQKGLRDHLLCFECERRFQVWEDWAAPVLKKDLWAVAEATKNPSIRILHDLHYSNFKLLVLSIFWRLALKNKHFSRIELGPHFSKIQKQLLEGNPGPDSQYAIVVARLFFGGKPELEGYLDAPLHSRISPAYRMHCFIAGGYAFFMIVGRDPLPEHLLKGVIRADGTGPILRLDAERLDPMHKLYEYILKQNPLGG